MRQAFLRLTYPLLMALGKLFRPASHLQWRPLQAPQGQGFHQLSAPTTDGQLLDFSGLTGRYVLVVNTASYCGYTDQLAQLSALAKAEADSLTILCFPSNDFKQQEPQSDAEIAQFCSLQYGSPYQLMRKTGVLPGPDQSAVFQWLSQPRQNGWCSQAPMWNFCKYLVGPEGQLLGFFAQTVTPDEVWSQYQKRKD